ncbi:hypothetical protein BJV78DRAFT_1260241 [Lactifluus subvellereus]|nr:hypothetical protein BJV78DRAFT_1260241 [Lactifluus subvellereus]
MQLQGGAYSTPFLHHYHSLPSSAPRKEELLWEHSLQRCKRHSGHHHFIPHTITHSTSPCVYTSP